MASEALIVKRFAGTHHEAIPVAVAAVVDALFMTTSGTAG